MELCVIHELFILMQIHLDSELLKNLETYKMQNFATGKPKMIFQSDPLVYLNVFQWGFRGKRGLTGIIKIGPKLFSARGEKKYTMMNSESHVRDCVCTGGIHTMREHVLGIAAVVLLLYVYTFGSFRLSTDVCARLRYLKNTVELTSRIWSLKFQVRFCFSENM